MNTLDGPILIAIDGAPPSDWMLPWSVVLAQQLGCGLRLVHPSDRVDDPLLNVPAGLRYLERVAAQARTRGVACDVLVAPGEPAEVVLEAAQASRARCISLVGQRPQGVDRWSSRNIARHVIHHASVPVLLQTGTIDAVESSRRSFGPVVVSLDGSKQAELALDVAIPIARTLGQTVSLVRAVNVPFPESEPSDLAIVSTGDVDAAKSYLHEVAHEVHCDGIWPMPMIDDGPSEQLIRGVVRAQAASLVVLTMRSYSDVTGGALGSVADEFVRHAGVPIMLVGRNVPASNDCQRRHLASAA